MKVYVALVLVWSFTAHAADCLFDFEKDAEVSAWTLRTPQTDRLTRVPRFASSGAFALRFTTPKWQKGKEQWPALEARLPGLDWRGYDRLLLDVVNTGEAKQFLSVRISDSKVPFRKGLAMHLPCPLRSFTRHVIPLSTFPGKVDRADISIVHLFAQRPATDMTLYLDNFVLLKKGEKAAEPSVAFIRQLADLYFGPDGGVQIVTEACRKVPTRSAAAKAAAESEIKAALARLDTLRGELASATPSLAALLGVKRELEALPVRVARCVAEAELRADFAESGLGDGQVVVALATSMEKIMPRALAFRATVAKSVALSLARNEREALQVLVMPGAGVLKNVRVRVGTLKTAAGVVFPAAGVDCDVMGYVRTAKAPPYTVSHVGWWPDPILDFLDGVDVGENDVQSFWVRVFAPKDQTAGVYRGALTVSADGVPAVSLELTVRVRDFSLPDCTPLPTAITFGARPTQMGGKDAWHTMKFRYADFLAEYRIDYDHLYRRGAPDFDVLNHLHDAGRLTAFNLGVFNGAGKGGDADAAIVANVARIRPAYEEAKRLGLLDHAYVYGFDERDKDQFPLLEKCAVALRKAFPEVVLMTTSYDSSFGVESCVKTIDAWCPLTPRFDVERAERARSTGTLVWWYICCSPKNPHANWFVEYAAIESRLLMGAMTAKYRPDGFLYYQISIWNRNKPIERGPYTVWNPRSWTTYHGDGSLICAGPGGRPLPTIRLENYRDGQEDYAYVLILEECIRRVEAKGKRRAEQTRWLASAKSALAVPGTLVASMREYSHDPQELYRWRNRLGVLIESSGIRDADPWGSDFGVRGFRGQ